MSEDADGHMFRSVIEYGRDALKAAILTNGGAAVALLAFIGTIWEKGISPDTAKYLTWALGSFSSGVLVTVVAIGFAYLTQLFYNSQYMLVGIIFHCLAVLLGFSSYLLFGCGAYSSYQAFSTHLLPLQ